MNFTQENNVQVSLPQFSEITSRPSQISNLRFTASQSQTNQNVIYTTATASTQTKQLLINSPTKYPSTILTWPDANALMQLCEKQGLQAINIPNYNQNNTAILSVQPNALPVRIIPNVVVPSQIDSSAVLKQDQDSKSQIEAPTSSITPTTTVEPQQVQLQSAAMAEYLQKLQATALPLTLQQLIKLQSDQVKKEKAEEETKVEQVQNNILNIPSVPVFRNANLHNGNHFMNAEHMMLAINPSDLNVHMEQPPVEEENLAIQTVPKVDQSQVQTESPKPEKKMKFRAKTGEIKITLAFDGSTLYCCPECNLAFTEKSEIEQHIQGHIQERKYQCKECGAMLKRKEHLDQHMRGHSDERPFKCPVCQKAFKRNEHLTRHYVIHSGDKNFSCTVCQKAFSRKDHLNKHTQTHLGIKRNKGRKDMILIDNKESLDKITDNLSIPKQDVNLVLKDGNFIKQDSSIIQQLHNWQKDNSFVQTFSAFKEQAMKDSLMLQQQAVNMNEILPQNTRYLMPS